MSIIYEKSSDWRRYKKEHLILESALELRKWKLFFTLSDKKKHKRNNEWRSKFSHTGEAGYSQREKLTRDFMAVIRQNLGIKRDRHFYWIARHEFGAFQNDPHIHILIDYNLQLSPEEVERALTPVNRSSWLATNGFDLCFRLKNKITNPFMIQDLEKAKRYFSKDESKQDGACWDSWKTAPERGLKYFCSVAFNLQIKNQEKIVKSNYCSKLEMQ